MPDKLNNENVQELEQTNEVHDFSELFSQDQNFIENFKNHFKSDETFKCCYELQDKFNCELLGKDWKIGENLTEWPVDFSIATLAEMGECIDSTKYGWWKKSRKEDVENIITELIDAKHFELCKILEQYPHDKDLINAILLLSWENSDFSIPFEKLDELSEYDKQFALNELIKKFSFFAIMPDEYKPQNLIEYYMAIFVSLFDLFKFFGVSKEEVVKRYLIKNALNFVRKNNGYSDGLYSKMWIDIDTNETLEDNIVAIRITKTLENDYNLISTYLNEYYTKNVKRD